MPASPPITDRPCCSRSSALASATSPPSSASCRAWWAAASSARWLCRLEAALSRCRPAGRGRALRQETARSSCRRLTTCGPSAPCGGPPRACEWWGARGPLSALQLPADDGVTGVGRVAVERLHRDVDQRELPEIEAGRELQGLRAGTDDTEGNHADDLAIDRPDLVVLVLQRRRVELDLDDARSVVLHDDLRPAGGLVAVERVQGHRGDLLAVVPVLQDGDGAGTHHGAGDESSGGDQQQRPGAAAVAGSGTAGRRRPGQALPRGSPPRGSPPRGALQRRAGNRRGR